MYDRQLVREILEQIHWSIQTISKRFEVVQSVDDFTRSDAGLEKLDSICMQLITIGESLKNIDKITNRNLLKQYPQIEWRKVKGMRDIISHHYFDLNTEAIYDVCENHLDQLGQTIELIINDLQK